MHPARHRALTALLVLLATGCGGDDDDQGDVSDAGSIDGGADGSPDAGADAAPPADAAVATCEPQTGTDLALERVAMGTDDGFEDPIFVTSPPGDGRLFVVGRPGAISIVKNGAILDEPFLDIRGSVTSGDELGLLGLAFHPDYANNGRFFVFYTAQAPSGYPNRLSEFRVSEGNPDVADPSSELTVLEIQDGETNHNGGMIAFGGDGFLYIGLGDGGGSGDDHGDIGNGQDRSTLLGDMLRIDIDLDAEGDGALGVPPPNPYEIPPGNPYEKASRCGEGQKSETCAEIFISGVRNPWRWSFDRANGDLYIGDVGQGNWEEIDVLPGPADEQAGANLGWRRMEGEECFDPPQNCELPGLTLPVAVYPNPGKGQAAVVGGYVYRGSCFPDIQGWYFYGDYITNQVWKLEYADGVVTGDVEVTADIDPDSELRGLSSFGEDALGELYAVSLRSGEVFHIVAGP